MDDQRLLLACTRISVLPSNISTKIGQLYQESTGTLGCENMYLKRICTLLYILSYMYLHVMFVTQNTKSFTFVHEDRHACWFAVGGTAGVVARVQDGRTPHLGCRPQFSDAVLILCHSMSSHAVRVLNPNHMRRRGKLA